MKMMKMYIEMFEVETETWDDSSQIQEVKKKKRNGINTRINLEDKQWLDSREGQF